MATVLWYPYGYIAAAVTPPLPSVSLVPERVGWRAAVLSLSFLLSSKTEIAKSLSLLIS